MNTVLQWRGRAAPPIALETPQVALHRRATQRWVFMGGRDEPGHDGFGFVCS
jgi:hypothetical protein